MFISSCFRLTVCCLFFLMIRRPPRSTRTDTLFPYTTLFRSRRPCGSTTSKRSLFIPRRPANAEPAETSGSAKPDLSFLCRGQHLGARNLGNVNHDRSAILTNERSEERRVGKECVSTCRSRWSPYH